MKADGQSGTDTQNYSCLSVIKSFRRKKLPKTNPLNQAQQNLLPGKMGGIKKLNIQTEHCHEKKAFFPTV